MVGSGSWRFGWILAVPLAVAALAITAVPALADAGDQSVAYQLDSGHDGYASGVTIAPPLSHAWTQTLSGAISYPLIVNGVVYVTAVASNGTNVYALTASDGQPAVGQDDRQHVPVVGPGLRRGAPVRRHLRRTAHRA